VALKHQKSKSYHTITGIVLNHKDYSNQSKVHDIFHFLVNGIDFSTVSVILRLDFGIVPMAMWYF
jgi:hypothetical protein